MRKPAVLVVLVMMIAALAGTGYAAEYDRYERGYRTDGPPPPPPSVAPAPAPQPRAVVVPSRSYTHYSQPYFAIQVGFYAPNDDTDGLQDFDTGGAFNAIIGTRVSPIFAVEGTIGGFGSDGDYDYGYYDREVTVVPLTVGVRLIVPNPIIEPYIGGGAGIYFSSVEFDTPYGYVDDDTADFGGYLSFGLDFWVSPRVALNFEGRYHWIEAGFDERDVDLSGWTGNFGIRVHF